MSSHEPDDTVPASAATTPPIESTRESVRPKKSAKDKPVKRVDKKEKNKQEEQLAELPERCPERPLFLSARDFAKFEKLSKKRCPFPAYDDSASKRRKLEREFNSERQERLIAEKKRKQEKKKNGKNGKNSTSKGGKLPSRGGATRHGRKSKAKGKEAELVSLVEEEGEGLFVKNDDLPHSPPGRSEGESVPLGNPDSEAARSPAENQESLLHPLVRNAWESYFGNETGSRAKNISEEDDSLFVESHEVISNPPDPPRDASHEFTETNETQHAPLEDGDQVLNNRASLLDSPGSTERVCDESMTETLEESALPNEERTVMHQDSPSGPPIITSLSDLTPIAAMGKFAELSTEIRDEIFRYLLVCPQEIQVFHGWSLVFPRSRPRLDLSILYTCKVLRHQGLRILFGENTFAYDVRDPGGFDSKMNETYKDCVVPIDKYGHLIRHVKIKVQRNRMHDLKNFETCMEKFLPGNGLACAARFHTLTLEIPAESQRALKLPGANNLDDVPICQYLRMGSRFNEVLLQLQILRVRVLAWDRHQKCWEAMIDMRYFAKDEQMRLEHAAFNECEAAQINRIDDLSETVAKDATNRYRPKDVEAMEQFWDRQVKYAVESFESLAWRIEGLALEPERAVVELGLWKPVVASLESNITKEFMSHSGFRPRPGLRMTQS